jgi:hypothetical protein
MTAQFWLGLAAVPALAATAAVLYGLFICFAILWDRYAPSHWAFNGPQRHARPAADLFRFTDVAGGHAESLRRLIRLGPWGVYVIRYAPGRVEVPEPERIP